MESPTLVLCDLGPTDDPRLESYSPFCLKAHRALKLACLPYETLSRNAPADFAHLNPARQVPILLIDGEPVSDSTAILARISELAPGKLEPSDPRVRAEAWLWEDFADRSLSGFVVAARWADEDNWPTTKRAYFGEAPWFVQAFVVPRIRKHVVGTLIARDVLRSGLQAFWDGYRRTLDHLEARAPQRAFWVSERASVADLGLFAQLRQLRNALLTPAYAREIAIRPNLDDWLDRVDVATRGPALRLAAAA